MFIIKLKILIIFLILIYFQEERKATGRTIAIVIFLSVMCVALYQVVQRRKTALAGVSKNTFVKIAQ